MSNAKEETIVVIGAGVIGLTTALCLQRHISNHGLPYRILIVAQEFPNGLLSEPSPNYASMWAGAHVRPIPADTPQLQREARWLKRSCQMFGPMAQAEPWIGITPLKGVEYLATPTKGYLELFSTEAAFAEANGLDGYRKMHSSELPDGIKMGFEYNTFCINSPLYCLALLRKLLLGGASTVRKALASEWEAFGLAENVKMVINASGMGFNDPECFPIRGQTCLISAPFSKTITQQNADGTWTFIIPRGFDGGTVIGGTKEPNDWDSKPSLETRKRLLQGASEMKGGLGSHRDVQVVTDIVGRRPARNGGMRIEVEARQASGNSRTVVHAYGAAGRGFEISWGVAEEVLSLVEGSLQVPGETVKDATEK